MNNKKGRNLIVSISSPIILLLIWELIVRLNFIDARFFPPPTSIIVSFWKLLISGELIHHIGISSFRLIIGFFVGAIPGLILGIIMGISSFIRAALYPIIAATYPIPKSAILPLIVLIFGLGEMSKIVAVAIGVFFLVLINTMSGVINIDKIYLDVGENFGANKFNLFITIALPGALPSIFTGLKLGTGIGLILIVMAEMIGANDGLGYMIWDSWQIFAIESMYVALVVISILGYLSSISLDLLEKRMIPWKDSQ